MYLLNKSYTCHLNLTTLCLPGKNYVSWPNLILLKNHRPFWNLYLCQTKANRAPMFL